MIDQLLKDIVRGDEEVYSLVCRVLSVDNQERTCTVDPVDGQAEIKNVWLQSAPNGTKGIVIMPKVGSLVLVSMLSKEKGFVANTFEVDRVELMIEDVLVRMDGQGLYITDSSENFAKTVSDLVNESQALAATVKGLILLTSSGPTTGISPTSLAALQEHELRFEQIENSFSKMLIE